MRIYSGLDMRGEDRAAYDCFTQGESNSAKLSRASSLMGKIIENELTEKQRRYVLGHYFEGRTVTDIAREDGVNKSTVSRTLARGKKRIENSLKYVMQAGEFES